MAQHISVASQQLNRGQVRAYYRLPEINGEPLGEGAA